MDLPARATASAAKVRRGRRRARYTVLALVHVAVLAHVLHWKLGGRTLSPLEPSEARDTLVNGAVNAGFVLLAVALAATAIVGRFFCGWGCHVVLYQDLAADFLARIGLRVRAVRSRFLMAVPFLVALDLFVVPAAVAWVRRGSAPEVHAGFLTDELWATFPGLGIALLTLFVDGFLVVWMLGSKGFCTNGCPYGALLATAGRRAPGGVVVSDACRGCAACTEHCSSNVRVHEEVARFGRVVDPGCMRTLDCVAVCPTGALSFRFGGTKGRERPPLLREREFDFGIGEELLLASVSILAFFGYRGLYHLVPLLLAVGLAILSGASAVVLARLVRRRDVTIQGRVLRSEGRLTVSGRVAALALGLFLLLGAESLATQAATRLGARAIERAELATSREEREILLDTAERHLIRAERLGLAPNPELELRLGTVDLARGRYDEAKARMRRAIELAPAMKSPHLGLAEAALASGDLDLAEKALDDLLRLDPANLRGRWRAAQLAIFRGDLESAEPILEAVLRDDPHHAGARADLERLREVRRGPAR